MFAAYYTCSDLREAQEPLRVFLLEAMAALEAGESSGRIASLLKKSLLRNSQRLDYHLDGDLPMVLYRLWLRWVCSLRRVALRHRRGFHYRPCICKRRSQAVPERFFSRAQSLPFDLNLIGETLFFCCGVDLLCYENVFSRASPIIHTILLKRIEELYCYGIFITTVSFHYSIKNKRTLRRSKSANQISSSGRNRPGDDNPLLAGREYLRAGIISLFNIAQIYISPSNSSLPFFFFARPAARPFQGARHRRVRAGFVPLPAVDSANLRDQKAGLVLLFFYRMCSLFCLVAELYVPLSFLALERLYAFNPRPYKLQNLPDGSSQLSIPLEASKVVTTNSII